MKISRNLKLFVALVLVFCTLPVVGKSLPSQDQLDLRVLIDVSGSMKKSDPNNLRAPALRLLVKLLPKGSKAGVWTFGQFVKMQVPLAAVDKRWKKSAVKAAGDIHSRGLFTDIEQALVRASIYWDKPNPRQRRNIIILSDGMVDVSKDKSKNTQSRNNILESVLPDLQSAGVTIHTIGLSDNVDKKLLETIATKTDGWYQQVNSAESLQRVFLHLFEKTTKVDTVPLKENRFNIDKSIKDMTVLIFNKANAKMPRIVTPKRKSFGQKDHPKYMQWHHEQGFDIVTVNKPAIGTWRIESEKDPDNRVVVVTNLKLKVEPFPNNVILGEKITVYAKLVQESKLVKEKKLLKKTKVKLLQEKNSKNHSILMKDNGKHPDKKAGDSVYSAYLDYEEKSGVQNVVVRAEGPTFQREYRHSLKVHGYPIKISADYLIKEQGHQINLVKQQGFEDLHVNSLEVKPMGKLSVVNKAMKMGKNTWSIELDTTTLSKKVELILEGIYGNNRKISLTWFDYLPKSIFPQSQESDDLKTEKKVAVEDSIAKEKEGSEISIGVKGWLAIGLFTLFFNAIVGIMGLGTYWYWKKSKVSKAEEPEVFELS